MIRRGERERERVILGQAAAIKCIRISAYEVADIFYPTFACAMRRKWKCIFSCHVKVVSNIISSLWLLFCICIKRERASSVMIHPHSFHTGEMTVATMQLFLNSFTMTRVLRKWHVLVIPLLQYVEMLALISCFGKPCDPLWPFHPP